jgi:hypothetical protein
MRAPDVPPARRGGRKRRTSTRTEALLAGADFEPLLDSLEKHVAAAATRSFGPVDRQVLRSIIVEAAMMYEGTRYFADEASRCTLHELAEPLARVIQLLEHDANRDDVFVALGAPAALALSPDQRAVEEAVARYEILLRDLDKIARAVPQPPAKPGPGKPSRTMDLHALVERLADYWERATGQRFTQHWLKGAPLTPATEFVHAVVRFIDAERLGALPKVTERIVTKRRAASSN